MNKILFISLKSTNPENVGTNITAKGKKSSLTGMFIKYLTSTGKEINQSIIKQDKPKDKKNDFSHMLSKLLKKQIVKKHSSNDKLDFKELLQIIDKKQIDYSEYQNLFEIILNSQTALISEENLKSIFTQTRNSNGSQPSNIEVFLYRFLIINIINIDNSIHTYDAQFLRLLQFLFNIPYFYIEECIFLLSIVFNDLTTLINNHILNPNCSNDASTNQFVESLSILCINYLLDEILTNHNHFASYEMHYFLQAHLVDQMIYFCDEKITHLKHIIMALTKVNLKISINDIPFFYDPLIKSVSYYVKNALNQDQCNDSNKSSTINFIFFVMDKIFSISNEIIKYSEDKNPSQLIVSQSKIFKTLPSDFALFIIQLFNSNKWINSLDSKDFVQFSEKEANLFNNDKNYHETDSIIIESINKNSKFDFQKLREELTKKDLHSIVDYSLSSFKNDYEYLNKFILQMDKYENKILLIILIKEITLMILNQVNSERSIQSAAKMLILINIFLKFSQEDFFIFMNEMNLPKNPNEPKFSLELVDTFIFDEKYFYFSNPTSRNSVLFAFLNHDNNDSLFNIVNKLPIDIELYENIRKSILTLFCNNFQFLSTNFINLIMKKIDNSVQPQVSNFFISMLRIFIQIHPDLAIKTMRSIRFFDAFSDNYLQRLRSYYIYYRKDEDKSFISDYVQEYRYNSVMFLIQLTNNVTYLQTLFSSSKIVNYFFKYSLYEEDNCSLTTDLIKHVINSLENKSDDNIFNSNKEIDNLTVSLIKTIENCSDNINKNTIIKDTQDKPFDYSSYCLQILHVFLTIFGDSVNAKLSLFSQSLINHNFPSILCSVPNKLLPINNLMKFDIICDILYIICGMTKDNSDFRKRLIASIKKQKLAQFINSIEMNDKIYKYLLVLIFEEEIDLNNDNANVDIKFNKALPFLHIALLNKPEYSKVFNFIYNITTKSLTNKIQIYKSKLLNLFIGEIQKYPDIRKITKQQRSDLDIMLNIFQIITSSLLKPQTLLEVLKALQKKDNKERPWYISQFIKIFNIILTKNEELETGQSIGQISGSTSFFHFNGNKTGISIPTFSIADKESFSFVCRFQLDTNYNINTNKSTLLSFYANENKIKLFFTKSGLSVKHKAKNSKSKSKDDIEKVNFQFNPNIWYTLILRGTSNDKLELFVNSDKSVMSMNIKTCIFDTISNFTVANSSLKKNKGLACNISVIYFFNKAISADKIKDLMSLPYKFSYLFTLSNQYLYPNLPRSLFADEKFGKSLIFCYNSNMFDGQFAVNLVRGNSTIAPVKGINVPYNSSFIGAIASLGGIKIFLPLLEIIDLHSIGITESEENNNQLLILILEIFILLNRSSADFENDFCNSNGIQAFAHAFSKISKSNIDKLVFSSLSKFYFSFRNDANKNNFIQSFWFNYNVWDKITLEQHQDLINLLKLILSKHEELFKKYITYPFLLSVLRDINDDNVRELYFSFIESYNLHYFVKQDQKFMFQLVFASEGIFQGQVLKTLYLAIENGNECYNRLYGTNVYSNLIALSSSFNEETRIYAVKLLLWMKNNSKKEPVPLNSAILSFIKTLNYENITDRTWNELEKSVFEENKITDRFVELLPLFASYSHYANSDLAHNFIQKIFDITKKSNCNYKLILSSPNWALNLFYIYLNSKIPVLNFSEEDVIVDFFVNIILFLINSSNFDEYRNILNELYLIQFIHYLDVSLLVRQIFTVILNRNESQSPNVYKVILPDIFIYLFFIPSYNVGPEVIPFVASYDHSKQDLIWIDFIFKFNFCSKSISRSRSNTANTKEEIPSNADDVISLSSNSYKIKIDLSNFKGYLATRITPEGKWADLNLINVLLNRFMDILQKLQGKQFDKVMTVTGHNSSKLSISLYDFFVVIEMICIILDSNQFNANIPLICSHFLKSSPNKKQALQIISYMAMPIIDQDDRAEILYGYIKAEYPKEIDAFVKKEKKTHDDVKNKLNDKSVQIKFFEYFYKGILDIFDSVANDCLNYYKNNKDLTDLAKSSLEMIQHESYELIPRIKFVRRFNDQYLFILLNMKDTCLSAYQKISQEIISYESGSIEKTNLHWKLCKQFDSDLRHIYYKINNHFDYEKYKKLSKLVNENISLPSAQDSASAVQFQTSRNVLLDEDQESDDDDDIKLENINNDFDEFDDEPDQNLSKLSPTVSSDSSSGKTQKENYLFTTKAVLIMISMHFSGTLSIGKNGLYFIGKEMSSLMNSTSIPDKYLSKKKPEEEIITNDNNIDDDSSKTKTVQINFVDVKWFLLRNYLHVKEGFEIFLTNHKSYFFFLTEFNRSTVINILTKYKKSLTNCTIFQSSPEKIYQIIQESKIVESWANGSISNYYYLIILNLLAGRSFNDTTQYPVFPWVLKEYNKSEIDLDDESIYRDLSRPISTLGEGKLEKIQMQYETIEEEDDENKIHNRLFYSNDMSVSILMLRSEPFTTTYLYTQRKFDLARFPNSISKLYNASIEANGFELVPEYFTTSEIFVNNDKDIVYGNDSYNKVVFPDWCIDQNPADFIKKHRLALESDYVSLHLNEWIDLIFGVAQSGNEAIKRYNTYPPKLYPKYLARHKNQIKEDPLLFKIVQDTAFCFGIVPAQIFVENHPQKIVSLKKAGFMLTNRLSNVLKKYSPSDPDSNTIEELNVNLAVPIDFSNLPRSNTKPIPLFTATNENFLVVLSSDTKLSVFSSKSSLDPNLKGNSARAIQVATDLSSFILLKNSLVNSSEDVKTTSLSTTKGFCFLSNKLVVTSPFDSEIRIFKIESNHFNYLIHSSSAQEFNLQSCLDLTNHKPSSGSSVFKFYSAIQLPCAVLMTCPAGPKEFLSVSSDFAIIKWTMKNKPKVSEEATASNNHEFGSKSAENSEGTIKRADRRQRKSSFLNLKLITSFMNKVKLVYSIIPHSTKIVAIAASSNINVVASCDKEKNLILSRLSDGVFIRSFKTPHKVKSVIVSDEPCIVVSQISKSDPKLMANPSPESIEGLEYATVIQTFSINNNMNDNTHEVPIAQSVFDKKTLTAWCKVRNNFGFDNHLACCFNDKSLVVLSLPMMNLVCKTTLPAIATHVSFNNQYAVLVVACDDGALYSLRC